MFFIKNYKFRISFRTSKKLASGELPETTFPYLRSNQIRTRGEP